MKLFLIVGKGKRRGESIPIEKDLFMMGSDAICQLRSKLPGIAPQHCALVTREAKAFVRDLEGGETFINNELLPAGEEWPVHSGDRLLLGPLEFVIQFQEQQLSQKDAEEWALKSLDQEYKEEEEAEEDASTDTAASAAAAILGQMASQRGVVKGRLRVSQNGNVSVIGFNDNFLVEEAEIAFIKKELINSLQRAGKRVMLDFKNVERMSSAAAEMILEIRRRLNARGGSLALCRVNPDLHMILETLSILPMIPHFQDKNSGLAKDW